MACSAPAQICLDDDGRLDEDLPCVGCRYNLRAMAPDGACPECGRAIDHSTRVAKLYRRDPGYLRRVARGVRWLMVGAVCMMLVGLFAYHWYLFEHLRRAIDVIAIPLFAAGVVICVLGFIWVTTPHEPELGDEGWLSSRRIGRISMPIAFALLTVCIVLSNLLDELGVWPYMLVTWLLLLAVGAAATLIYAGRLAAQVRHRLMGWQLTAVGVLLALNVISPMLYYFLQYQPDLLPTWPGFKIKLQTVPEMVSFAGATGMALTLWTIPLLLWYHRRLTEALRIAGQEQSRRCDGP